MSSKTFGVNLIIKVAQFGKVNSRLLTEENCNVIDRCKMTMKEKVFPIFIRKVLRWPFFVDGFWILIEKLLEKFEEFFQSSKGERFELIFWTIIGKEL